MVIKLIDFKHINFDKFIKGIDFDEGQCFLDGYKIEREESVIYGNYEYIGGIQAGYFGHLYKEWTSEKTEYIGGGYSGEVDSFGHVTLTQDVDTYTTKTKHTILRRDLCSLEDEILRYAEYCVRYIWSARPYINNIIKNNDGAGIKTDPEIFRIKDFIDSVDFTRTYKDYLYAIRTKKVIATSCERFFDTSFNVPVGNNETYDYPFISSVMAPDEEAFIKKYGKKRRDNAFVETRKKLHFEYLEEMAEQLDIDFYNKQKYEVEKLRKERKFVGRNPLKGFWFIASIIWVIFFSIFGTYVIVTGIQKGNIKTDFNSLGGNILALICALLPGIIIFFVSLKKHKAYKKRVEINEAKKDK